MNGEQLYNEYRTNLAERGCGTDTWVDLNPQDQEDWNSLAGRLPFKTSDEQRDLEKLWALEGGGVDNWDNYDDSLDEWRKKWFESDVQ